MQHENLTQEVYDLILRRSCTFGQAVSSLDIDNTDLLPVTENLLAESRIIEIESKNGKYYRAV